MTARDCLLHELERAVAAARRILLHGGEVQTLGNALLARPAVLGKLRRVAEKLECNGIVANHVHVFLVLLAVECLVHLALSLDVERLDAQLLRFADVLDKLGVGPVVHRLSRRRFGGGSGRSRRSR